MGPKNHMGGVLSPQVIFVKFKLTLYDSLTVSKFMSLLFLLLQSNVQLSTEVHYPTTTSKINILHLSLVLNH